MVQLEPLRCLQQEWPCHPWDRQCPECVLSSWAPPGIPCSPKAAETQLLPLRRDAGEQDRAALSPRRSMLYSGLFSRASGPCSIGSSAAGGEEWAAMGAVGVIPNFCCPFL